MAAAAAVGPSASLLSLDPQLQREFQDKVLRVRSGRGTKVRARALLPAGGPQPPRGPRWRCLPGEAAGGRAGLPGAPSPRQAAPFPSPWGCGVASGPSQCSGPWGVGAGARLRRETLQTPNSH